MSAVMMDVLFGLGVGWLGRGALAKYERNLDRKTRELGGSVEPKKAKHPPMTGDR